MEINKTERNGISVIELSGRCDLQDYDNLNEHLNKIVETGEKKLILDLSSLHFINSAGLRAIIVTVQKMSSAGGSVAFCNVNETIEKLFSITGYASILSRFDSLEAAAAHLHD